MNDTSEFTPRNEDEVCVGRILPNSFNIVLAPISGACIFFFFIIPNLFSATATACRASGLVVVLCLCIIFHQSSRASIQTFSYLFSNDVFQCFAASFSFSFLKSLLYYFDGFNSSSVPVRSSFTFCLQCLL